MEPIAVFILSMIATCVGCVAAGFFGYMAGVKRRELPEIKIDRGGDFELLVGRNTELTAQVVDLRGLLADIQGLVDLRGIQVDDMNKDDMYKMRSAIYMKIRYRLEKFDGFYKNSAYCE